MAKYIRKTVSLTILEQLDAHSMWVPTPYWPDLGDCQIWTGSLNAKGYGRISTPGNARAKTHRISWTEHRGEIPDGLWVLHRCDNRPCFRIEHLFLGTHQDNMEDKVQKARGVPVFEVPKELDKCKNGHSYREGSNFAVTKKGKPRCRACAREAKVRQRTSKFV